MGQSRVVIVGGGHGASSLAGFLRQGGFTDEIVIISEEDELPYHRPPLSKDFLGAHNANLLRPAQFYTDQNIQVLLNQKVTSINRFAKEVQITNGEILAYGTLVLATGAQPRQLPVEGHHLDGVLTLRSLRNSRKLGQALKAGGNLAIVGGGYIGMEVAAAARAQGIGVTILEREHRVLARVASPELSAILASHHRANGVDIRTSIGDLRFVGDPGGHVRAVALESGAEIVCDTVLVAAGAVPRDELAQRAGIACDGGIIVDAYAMTNDPDVLAIGDATTRPIFRQGRLGRVESIPSVTEQAKQASSTILGSLPPPSELPWFWSDQFDLKLKMAGAVRPDAQVVVRDEKVKNRFALFHHEKGRVIAVETANYPAAFVAARHLIAHETPVDIENLGNPSVDFRDLVGT
ncbi:NAD(P)/FAD-dependent oxidoreductase [Arthrobacter sp. P2b]|uniref:NAD(P)/FAD-dependent oxidoreductase n=1 Tax=Arthrobacter sp. P2b TaxID=1938741 RepID=UPI0009A638B6|nr:FAD-dependent oxidoreductase [Arthrobacter sp. P2b]SLK10493.1 3-phenylpropionate/trans-cinnamate dioxygenase ferredoxin reductase subunit [Arthrobacter sp. P2b]